MISLSRRNIIRLAVFTALSAAVLGFWFNSRDAIAHRILTQIRVYTDRNLPATVDAQGITFRLIPPSAELSNIKITLDPGVADEIKLIRVGSIRGNLDFLQLLAGRIALSSLLIDEPELVIDLDPLLDSTETSSEIPWKKIFESIQKIPLRRIALLDLRLQLVSEKRQMKYAVTAGDLLAELHRERIELEARIRESYAMAGDQEKGTVRAHLQTIVSKQGITLNKLEVDGLGSRLKLSGTANLPAFIHQVSGAINFDGEVNGEIVSDFLRPLVGKLPKVSGTVKSEGQVSLTNGEPTARVFVATSNLIVEDFIVDEVLGEFNVTPAQVTTKNLKLNSAMGLVFVEAASIELKNDRKLEVTAKSEMVDMRQLLIQVTAGDIPLELLFSPQVKCAGALKPSFILDCAATATADHLEVRSEEKVSSTIVIIDHFEADGKFQVNSNEVTYTANVRVGENKGTSEGRIHYDHGFQIKYQTDALNFGNVRTLAGLQVGGTAGIKGSTEGDSKAAIFSLDFDGKDVVFEKYFLGTARGTASYRKGTIGFTKLEGQVGNSKYEGEVAVDLLKERVKAKGSTQNAQLQDILKVFEGIVVLPFAITGEGKASVETEGPLDFSRLSYKMNSEVKNLSIFGENFQSLRFDVVSDNGEVRIVEANAKKGRGLLSMTGVAHPNAQVELNIVGKDLTLEESENIVALDSNVSGKLDVVAKMTGHILRPTVNMDLGLRQMVIEEMEFEDSKGLIALSPSGLSGEVRLFGSRLISDFAFPLNENSPFRLKLDADNWDYTTIFTLIGGGRLISEYEASLSGSLNLGAEKGGLFRSTGSGTIQTLLLRRGPLLLENIAPMQLTMNQGLVTLKDFRLKGPNSRVEVTGQDFNHERLNLELSADMDVRLLNIFFPFLDELGGRANLKTKVTGSILEPELLGAISVKDGFTKIRALPHAIEKISADAQFSRKRVNISRIDGYMAGGTLAGNGEIQIVGYRNIPTNIDLKLDGVNLNIPTGIQTSGSAKLAITGSWFPFTLSGKYDIDRGLMTKEFTENSSRTSVQQSAFLPRMILKSAFEPLLLDLNVIFEKNFLAKNSMLDGSLSGELRVQGVPNLPALSGQVDLDRNSKLLFQDKVFEVTAGSAKFTGSSDVNPDLYITARSRIQEYDISMIVQGPAKTAYPRLTSIPPLSETDLVTLLALGVTSERLEKNVENQAQESSTSYQIGTAILENNPLTKSLQESLGVSFQFSSAYDDESGAAIRKFTVSRKLTDRLRASVTRAEGQQISMEGKINYQIDQNWSAVGTVDNREASDSTSITDTTNSQSIFGLDLEFRREFR